MKTVKPKTNVSPILMYKLMSGNINESYFKKACDKITKQSGAQGKKHISYLC